MLVEAFWTEALGRREVEVSRALKRNDMATEEKKSEQPGARNILLRLGKACGRPSDRGRKWVSLANSLQGKSEMITASGSRNNTLKKCRFEEGPAEKGPD